jgi:ribosomal protein S18 acetylase RimI-like enzyme
MNIEIKKITSPTETALAKKMFQEYEAFLQTNICFQNFNEELENLNQLYAYPDGAIWLAFSEGQPVGCVALKRHSKTAAEMKRLYVNPRFQGNKVGSRLIDEMIKESIRLGYERIKLEVLSKSEQAIKLYKNYGFKPTAPIFTTEEVVCFFELEIR